MNDTIPRIGLVIDEPEPAGSGRLLLLFLSISAALVILTTWYFWPVSGALLVPVWQRDFGAADRRLFLRRSLEERAGQWMRALMVACIVAFVVLLAGGAS